MINLMYTNTDRVPGVRFCSNCGAIRAKNREDSDPLMEVSNTCPMCEVSVRICAECKKHIKTGKVVEYFKKCEQHDNKTGYEA